MINAKEARQQMEQLNTAKEKMELEAVENSINKDIKRGYTYYYGKLSATVGNKIMELGYKVEYHTSQRDGDITTIRW